MAEKTQVMVLTIRAAQIWFELGAVSLTIAMLPLAVALHILLHRLLRRYLSYWRSP